jgi:PAS domain S-box-containing protein
MLGGLTDLSERKRTEERLAEQAALLDAANEPIVVRDLEDRVLYWSKGAERTYGWSAEEVVGRPMSEIFPDNEALAARAMPVAIETGEWKGETTRRARDGRMLEVELRWTLLRDESGAPRGVLCIHADVSERKRLEQQILRAQRMDSIGTLAGGIAHDLNNLLAPILVSIGALEDGEADPERREDLETIRVCARRGADLVRQLLTFARGMEGRRVEVDLATVARELVRLVRDTFPKNISFQLEADDRLWEVLGDPTQLNQVMVNLCVNARDAMPAGGCLRVEVRNAELDTVWAAMNGRVKPGKYVRLRVDDTGMGIPPEVLDRIFEPFFTTKELGKGTGLGLSTTHVIVKGHGGFLNVTSEPGRGSRFDVYFPACETAAREPFKGSAQRTELVRGQGECVLVVDDEAPIRAMLRRTLQQFGYRVLLAAHGAEAVSQYAQHRGEIAAVLTDLAMPVMDGPALVVALKSIDPAVRIIGSSGLDASGEFAKLEHFLPKPYTTEELLRTLKDLLSR